MRISRTSCAIDKGDQVEKNLWCHMYIYRKGYGEKQYRTTDLQCGEQQIKETKFAVASVIQVLKK
jgi:hypothetical protein